MSDEDDLEEWSKDYGTAKISSISIKKKKKPNLPSILLNDSGKEEEEEDEDEELHPDNISSMGEAKATDPRSKKGTQQPSSSSSSSSSSFAPTPAPAPTPTAETQVFKDALLKITDQPNDIASWEVFLEEACSNRGGDVTTPIACEKFITQFPRAAKVWSRYGLFYASTGDFTSAEEVFKRCLQKCKSVTLWEVYIQVTRNRTIDRVSKYSDHYELQKKTLYSAYEKALDSVGMSLYSGNIWKGLLDFVSDWPEVVEADAASKLKTLREIYRKAIAVPTQEVETIWKNYETLEKKVSETLADQILPEFYEKFRFSKMVYEKRKTMHKNIVVDAICEIPSNSLKELKILDAWNKLTTFELSNPEGCSNKIHRNFMQLHFIQALGPLRLYPEVWICYADFMLLAFGSHIAREIYREAIQVLPDVIGLRMAFAELEESISNAVAAKDILKQAYIDSPCSFTFSLWQRLVRRLDGTLEARRCFSETYFQRRQQFSEQVDGLFFYAAHAQLEFETNKEPSVALKVLKLARSSFPKLTLHKEFFQLWMKILIRSGDIIELRNLFKAAISDRSNGTLTTFTPRERLRLFEDYFSTEIQKGMLSYSLLNELRVVRNKLREDMIAKEEMNGTEDINEANNRSIEDELFAVVSGADINSNERKRKAGDGVVASGGSATKKGGFADIASKVYERIGENITKSKMPHFDALAMRRCLLGDAIDKFVKRNDYEEETSERLKRNKAEMQDVVANLSVPNSIRNFLYKLPSVYNPSSADILRGLSDGWIENLQKIQLLPRVSN